MSASPVLTGIHSLECALRLWTCGLSVIPVPRPDPASGHDGKRPAIAWTVYQSRRPSEAEIRGWFATEQNIAVITGAVSEVVVVDADSPDALQVCTRRLPYTPWQTQTARGFHLWYRHPGVRVPNCARIDVGSGSLAIDVRGDGGFVIAPGSMHASGGRYTYAGDWTIARGKLPRFWPGWLARPRRTTRENRCRPAHIAASMAVDRARGYLAAIPPRRSGRAATRRRIPPRVGSCAVSV